MLNNRKSTPNNGSENSNSSPSVNILSEGTKLKGDLSSQTDIRIAGTVEGEAVSKGKLIVTGNGKIIGNITSADADIAGKVEGEVKVSGKLTLRESAVIDGNIYTKTLIVEEGAQINGSCRMGTDAKSLSQSSDSDYVNDTKVKSTS
ncbi:MAG: polymer-forming cytoskeletal protein [Gracilimonas sp.]|uniref:bactofilin family protein n=1 Tax=Gracilimonas TaxID=649462 RepID=UPI001B2C57EC|nr:polymer-forming cytoskeletal protein [Gracilimonas sp.]MBO6586692.1 polymer-forming cytoskeletal protein [Gracilimonas sp.]MBO6615349.1 polymer-forming cytoskeletal protein [Gracilimonas sp.]